MNFSKDTFGIELDDEALFTLYSILEFVHRESKTSLAKRISPEEVEFAKKVSDDIKPYIDEFEYEVK